MFVKYFLQLNFFMPLRFSMRILVLWWFAQMLCFYLCSILYCVMAWGGGEWSWWWCWLTNSRVKTCFNTCTGLLVLIGLLTTHGNTLLGHSQKYFGGGGVVGGSLGWYCSESVFHDSGMNQFLFWFILPLQSNLKYYKTDFVELHVPSIRRKLT